MAQPTITGELRKWHHDHNSKGEKCVIGQMYNDIGDIWEDGDTAVIFYKEFYESANFYLAVVNRSICVKCPKDEEIKDGPKFNGNKVDLD